MAAGDRFDPGAATRDMDRSEVDYEEVERDVDAALEKTVSAASSAEGAEFRITQILKAMRETHQSMRSVYSAADHYERRTGQKTGRWMDAVLLARPQYDAAFIGLLLAHNEAEWVPKYLKAGWAANAVRCIYNLRRLGSTPAGRAEGRRVLRHLHQHARHLGISKKEWFATIAEVRGIQLPARNAARRDAIAALPTPGKIIDPAHPLLGGGPYERLGQLLWQQWRLLCDPNHIGIGILVNKSALREERELDRPRERFIQGEVICRAVIPSFVAIMTLVTVLAARHRDNVDLMAKVVQAWKILEAGTLEGGIIWDGWARDALGVLGS